jgi:hypothetical protein
MSTTSSGRVRATFESLSPQQRVALIDQATFFGMDLRAAGQAVLCGGSRVGISSASSAPSSDATGSHENKVSQASTQSEIQRPPQLRPALEGPVVDEAPSTTRTSLRRPALVRVLLQKMRFAAAACARAGSPIFRYIAALSSALADRLDVVLAMIDSLMAALGSWVAGNTIVVLRGLYFSFGTASKRVFPLACEPLWRMMSSCMRTLRALRRHSTGRHVSNLVGCVATIASIRTVVFAGPILGAMLYAPLEAFWIMAGLTDLRVFIVACMLSMAGLLRLYAALGWLD